MLFLCSNVCTCKNWQSKFLLDQTKLCDQMMKQLWGSVITNHRYLSVSILHTSVVQRIDANDLINNYHCGRHSMFFQYTYLLDSVLSSGQPNPPYLSLHAWQVTELLTNDKPQYFFQPCPIIVNYSYYLTRICCCCYFDVFCSWLQKCGLIMKEGNKNLINCDSSHSVYFHNSYYLLNSSSIQAH